MNTTPTRDYAQEIDALADSITTCDCYACGGSGSYDNDGSPMCSSCEGTGIIEAGYERKIESMHRLVSKWVDSMYEEYDYKFDASDDDDDATHHLLWRERLTNREIIEDKISETNIKLQRLELRNRLFLNLY